MKIWRVIVCGLSLINGLEARIMDVSDKFDGKDEKPSAGIVSRYDEESQKDDSLKAQEGDLSSFLKENSENKALPQEEGEKPEPYLIVNTPDPSPPGGGLLKLNPHVIDEKHPDLFPKADVPWWENWWNGIKEWWLGNNESEQS